MIKLLILADDFTGALDSGVQLAKTGAITYVMTRRDVSFEMLDPQTQVLVVDTETRHLPAAKAKSIIQDISARATQAGVPIIYKKTDSALRGNIGAELEGALLGSKENQIYFIPAFPKLGRGTQNGVHYFNGIPIHETVFGKDPFEPVLDSFIPDIIRRQSKVPVLLVKTAYDVPQEDGQRAIILFDAQSDEDLSAIAAHFYQKKPTKVLAGCAGFAAYLPWVLNLNPSKPAVYVSQPGLLVVSGSLNPITAKQLKRAKEKGFECVTLTREQKQKGIPESKEGEAFLTEIMSRYEKKHRMLLASVNVDQPDLMVRNAMDEESRAVTRNMGDLVKRLLTRGLCGTIMATGGDTLQGVLNSIHCTDIRPLCEIETGVVLSRASIEKGDILIVSKSGGFGTDEVFVHVADFLERACSVNTVESDVAVIEQNKQQCSG